MPNVMTMLALGSLFAVPALAMDAMLENETDAGLEAQAQAGQNTTADAAAKAEPAALDLQTPLASAHADEQRIAVDGPLAVTVEDGVYVDGPVKASIGKDGINAAAPGLALRIG